jgi:hypothetical protein
MSSWTELMQMILPVAFDTAMGPCARKQRIASRTHRNCPVRLMSSTTRQSSRLMSVIAESFWIPAFATRRSMRPNASTSLSNIVRTSSSRYVGLERNGLAALIPDLADEIVGGARLGAVVHADRRARSGEGARARRSDAGAATRNESRLILQRPCGG